MQHPFNLRRVQVFVAVVEQGSLSRAAKSLGLAQSTASSHLAQLEAELGATLIDRGGGHARATESGGVFLEYARSLLALSAEAIDKVARLSDAPVAGVLTVGSTTTVTTALLPRLFSAFAARHPAIDIDLHVHNTSEVMRQVQDGRLPFAVIAAECPLPGVDAVRIMSEPQVVIAPGGHPLAGQLVPPSVLHGSRILVREEGSATRRYQRELLRQWRVPGARESTIASTSAIIGAVALGFGISCLPRTVVHDALQLGRVAEIRLDPPPPERPIHLIRPTDRPVTRIEELFLDFAREEGTS